MTPLSIAAIGWVIGSLVSKAVTEVLEAWAKRKGLGKALKTLKDQLLQLNALLTSAHSLPTNNLFLEELVHNLQQLAYKAENLLDELDYYRLEDQIQQKGTQDKVNYSNKSLVASSSSGHLLASHPIISTLEGLYDRAAPYVPVPLPETFHSQINLSRRMKELAEELQKYEEKVCNALQIESLVNISRKTEATNLPQTSPFHTETREVVGRNKERDELLLNLTNEESATVGKILVLAIVGCGGVGKTTLAGLVYNDPKVKNCFDIRSWICVSTRFDIVRFTREMLEGACDNRYDGLSNLEVLQKKLMDKLESKKFLLVLDDMWEDEDKSQWDKIIALLSNCMVKRAIILVTTRNKSVAKMVDARDTMYLEGLDKDVFLSFFSTCIFNDPNYKGNWRLRNIGQQIANKLKGNPLAAKTVSALLKKNPDERYLLKIRDSEEWKSQNGPNDIMPALRLSYEHMPFHLQRYFIVAGRLHSKILGVGKLTSLQELNYFHVQQDNGFEIEQLGSLKEIGGSLDIWGLENVKSQVEANKARLAEKGKLDALYLEWNHGEQENESVLEGLKPSTNLKSISISGYGGVASPRWLDPSLIFLESLTLDSCYSCELLPPIGELESLKRLKLSRLAVREIGLQCYGTRQSMKFPSLEELDIKKMPHLQKWVLSDQLQQFLCFQKLKKLTIRDCPELVDLPLSGSATSEVLERFPSLKSLEIEDCPLIVELPPLPYSSLLSFIRIKHTGFINTMFYDKMSQPTQASLGLFLDVGLAFLKVSELLAFHELSSLHSLTLYNTPSLECLHELSSLHSLEISSIESFHENLNIPHLHSLMISNISSLESLDLHSCVALTYLEITGCQSLTSLAFGDQMVCLRDLAISSCKTLSSIKGLKSWVNLETLYFSKCPGFIAAWNSASKEIERTEPDFSLSLKIIEGDFLGCLTLHICKQLTSLQTFTFTEERQVSLQLLTSIDLVDIEGCKKNLQSFPFNLFPSLEKLVIRFYDIKSLSTSSYTEITDEFKKLTSIKGIHICDNPLTICLKLRSDEMVRLDPDESAVRMMRMRERMRNIYEDDDEDEDDGDDDEDNEDVDDDDEDDDDEDDDDNDGDDIITLINGRCFQRKNYNIES